MREDRGWRELPDVIPDWVLEEGPLPEPLQCDCGCPDGHDAPSAAEVPWAAPGVTGLDPSTPGLPVVSRAVAAVQAAVDALEAVAVSDLVAAQALADGEALLAVEQRLRVLDLRRLADVGARGLHELVGFRSTKAWLRAHRPDGDVADAALASRLREFGVVRKAVESGTVPLASARKVLLALRKVSPHVDRPGGLIDSQPGDAVLTAVVQHVLALVCRSLAGLHEDDQRLKALLDRARALLAGGGSQLVVLEGAFTWLAESLPAQHLTAPLDELVLALLPSALEDRGEQGHRRRGLSLTALEDGTGWHLCGDLDLEAGERLWAALRAEAARDPRNPADTAAWAEASEQDKDLWSLGAALAGSSPRNKRQRLHDAFSRVLGRYLESGLGGTAGKVPVQVSVTLTDRAVTGEPGAPPPRADSGRPVPRSLVRRWWCDAKVTAFVLSQGGKALRVVHTQRTLTGLERRALNAEGGDRCAGEGCCPGVPDPLVRIRPHHLHGFAEDQVTSLEDTVPVCDVLHHDLHDRGRTVRLRDGRFLNERGFVDGPGITEHPPF